MLTDLDARPADGQTASPEHARLLRRVTKLAVVVASSLAALKLIAWILTGSVSMASSPGDSLLDIGASAVNLWAIRVALRPADQHHGFGHGNATTPLVRAHDVGDRVTAAIRAAPGRRDHGPPRPGRLDLPDGSPDRVASSPIRAAVRTLRVLAPLRVAGV